ncbi:MAG: lamin tail domain-containing protein [Cyclobacteriaceae bacterium]|nr:lamin tail domain-containing protein [Cyclobacteriaceae bacterium]
MLTLTESLNQEITAVFEPAIVNADDVVINEINYNSSESFNVGDWIELLNISDRDINVSGWRLLDGNDNEYIFPVGTIIERGNFLVICKDRKDFAAHFPDVLVVEKELDFGMSSGGDCITLLSSDNKQIDKVCYTNYTPWPMEPNGNGPTLSLIDAYNKNDVAENWLASQANGTPGARNHMITGIEEKPLAEIHLFPNPAKDMVQIQVTAKEGDRLIAYMNDMAGRQTVVADNLLLHSGQNEFTLNLGNHQPGVYIVTLNLGEQIFRSKLIISSQ